MFLILAVKCCFLLCHGELVVCTMDEKKKKERKSFTDDGNESRAVDFSRNRLKWSLFHRRIRLRVSSEFQSRITYKIHTIRKNIKDIQSEVLVTRCNSI